MPRLFQYLCQRSIACTCAASRTAIVLDIKDRCKDKKIVGSMFYIMQFLNGRIFVDASLPEIKSKKEKAAM